jgi:hypothetical protein
VSFRVGDLRREVYWWTAREREFVNASRVFVRWMRGLFVAKFFFAWTAAMRRLLGGLVACVLLVVVAARVAVAAEDLIWQVDLVDGGRVVGPVVTEAVEIRTEFGLLRVPVGKLTEVTPGLVSRPDWLRRVDGLIDGLGDAKAEVREQAERALVEIGPRVQLAVETASRDEDFERRLRARRVLRAIAESKRRARAWPRQDVVMAAGQRFAGKIVGGEIEIEAVWGKVRMPIADVESLSAPASRKVVDLLGEIDVERDAVAGGWTRDGTSIVSAKSNRARLQIPIIPPEEYELRLKIVPMDGRHVKAVKRVIADSLFLGVIVGGQQTHVAIDAFSDIGGPFTGFDLTDGRRVHDVALHKGPLLELGREAEIVFTVRREEAALVVDKKPVFTWKEDPKRLGVSPAWTYRDSRYLGIGSHQTSYKVTAYSMTPIDDAAAPAKVKAGDWVVRLRDGSLVVGKPTATQTLMLREATEAGELQATPIDQIKGLRLAADDSRIEVQMNDGETWTGVLDKTPANALLTFETRWGEVVLPVTKVRAAIVADSAVPPIADEDE